MGGHIGKAFIGAIANGPNQVGTEDLEYMLLVGFHCRVLLPFYHIAQGWVIWERASGV
jgi:uncharacterized protein YaiE (UPF0345 family)